MTELTAQTSSPGLGQSASAYNGIPNLNRSAWRIDWTEQADRHLSDMRHEGASLRAIATAFGLNRHTIAQRAIELGLHAPVRRQASLPGEGRKVAPDETNNAGRDPFPAGHALCWSLITKGTCLEGTDYVIPASNRLRRSKPVTA